MRIYVGNLPYRITEVELKSAFEAFGDVTSVTLVSDKFTGSPKGFGFIEMPSRDQALAAIEGLQGKDLGGRSLRIDEARPKAGGDGPRDRGPRRFDNPGY